jgi:hypothetical protein
MSTKNYVVLMGDIVSSRETPSELELHSEFNKIIKNINKLHKNIIISPLTITLGDEFQSLVGTFYDAFSIANIIRLELKNKDIEMRFVIGNAEIEEKILNNENSWNMIGPGLSETRDLLNDKKNKNCYRFHFVHQEDNLKDSIVIKSLNSLGFAMTAIENKWTKTQLETIYEYRRNFSTKEELAERLGKNRNSLYKNLKAAQLDLYEEFIESISFALKGYDSIWERK